MTLLSAGRARAQQDSALYLMGQVAMEDTAEQIPADLVVEMLCEGRVIRQSLPNEKGVFTFDLGSVLQPAGTDSRSTPRTGGLEGGFSREVWDPKGFNVIQGRVYLNDCLIRLGPDARFVAEEIQLGVRGLLDDPDVGQLVVRKVKKGPVGAVSVEHAAIPPEAESELRKAQEQLSGAKPNYSKAAGSLEKAIKVYPAFAEAWMLLGEVRVRTGDSKKAREAFSRAIEIAPEYLPPRVELGQLALEEHDWQTAIDQAREILKQSPDSDQGNLFLGLASYYLEDYEQAYSALSSIEEAGQAARYPVAILHLGLLRARLGRYAQAAASLRAYLELAPKDSVPLERRRNIEQLLQTWQREGRIDSP